MRIKIIVGWDVACCIGTSVQVLYEVADSGGWVIFEIEYAGVSLLTVLGAKHCNVMLSKLQQTVPSNRREFSFRSRIFLTGFMDLPLL
jgi:hypothetical protein